MVLIQLMTILLIVSGVSLLIGVALSYAYNFFMMRRLGETKHLIKAIKKRQMIIFLESEGRSIFRTIVHAYQNIGVTNGRELVILPEGSVKPCLNLNASQILHGDLYRSLAVPTEFLTVLHDLQARGLTDQEITNIFYQIMNNNISKMEDTKNEKVKEIAENFNYSKFCDAITQSDPTFAGLTEKEKHNRHDEALITVAEQYEKENPEIQTLKYYRAMPTIVKNFLQTGVNRVSLEMMLSNKILQEAFKKIGQTNIMQVLVGIGIMVLLIFLGLKFGLPAIQDLFSMGGGVMIPGKTG